jgi:hypothetical protein
MQFFDRFRIENIKNFSFVHSFLLILSVFLLFLVEKILLCDFT